MIPQSHHRLKNYNDPIHRTRTDSEPLLPGDCRKLVSNWSSEQWHSTNYEPGDIVLFSMKLVHAATQSKTTSYRISLDTRVMSKSDPSRVRWNASVPIPTTSVPTTAIATTSTSTIAIGTKADSESLAIDHYHASPSSYLHYYHTTAIASIAHSNSTDSSDPFQCPDSDFLSFLRVVAPHPASIYNYVKSNTFNPQLQLNAVAQQLKQLIDHETQVSPDIDRPSTRIGSRSSGTTTTTTTTTIDTILHHLRELNPSTFTSDALIHTSLSYILQRSTMSSKIILVDSLCKPVNGIPSNCNINNINKIIYPFHHENHWILVVIKSNGIFVSDSLSCSKSTETKLLVLTLCQLLLGHFNQAEPTNQFQFGYIFRNDAIRYVLSDSNFKQSPGSNNCGAYLILRGTLEILDIPFTNDWTPEILNTILRPYLSLLIIHVLAFTSKSESGSVIRSMFPSINQLYKGDIDDESEVTVLKTSTLTTNSACADDSIVSASKSTNYLSQSLTVTAMSIENGINNILGPLELKLINNLFAPGKSKKLGELLHDQLTIIFLYCNCTTNDTNDHKDASVHVLTETCNQFSKCLNDYLSKQRSVGVIEEIFSYDKFYNPTSQLLYYTWIQRYGHTNLNICNKLRVNRINKIAENWIGKLLKLNNFTRLLTKLRTEIESSEVTWNWNTLISIPFQLFKLKLLIEIINTASASTHSELIIGTSTPSQFLDKLITRSLQQAVQLIDVRVPKMGQDSKHYCIQLLGYLITHLSLIKFNYFKNFEQTSIDHEQAKPFIEGCYKFYSCFIKQMNSNKKKTIFKYIKPIIEILIILTNLGAYTEHVHRSEHVQTIFENLTKGKPFRVNCKPSASSENDAHAHADADSCIPPSRTHAMYQELHYIIISRMLVLGMKRHAYAHITTESESDSEHASAADHDIHTKSFSTASTASTATSTIKATSTASEASVSIPTDPAYVELENQWKTLKKAVDALPPLPMVERYTLSIEHDKFVNQFPYASELQWAPSHIPNILGVYRSRKSNSNYNAIASATGDSDRLLFDRPWKPHKKFATSLKSTGLNNMESIATRLLPYGGVILTVKEYETLLDETVCLTAVALPFNSGGIMNDKMKANSKHKFEQLLLIGNPCTLGPIINHEKINKNNKNNNTTNGHHDDSVPAAAPGTSTMTSTVSKYTTSSNPSKSNSLQLSRHKSRPPRSSSSSIRPAAVKANVTFVHFPNELSKNPINDKISITDSFISVCLLSPIHVGDELYLNYGSEFESSIYTYYDEHCKQCFNPHQSPDNQLIGCDSCHRYFHVKCIDWQPLNEIEAPLMKLQCKRCIYICKHMVTSDPAADESILVTTTTQSKHGDEQANYNDLLTIKPSELDGAGDGAFASKFISDGTIIGKLIGEQLTRAEFEQKYQAVGVLPRYVVQLSHNKFVDLSNCEKSSKTRFINTLTPQQIAATGKHFNCSLREGKYRQFCKIVATRNIEQDEELYVSYGRRYTIKSTKASSTT